MHLRACEHVNLRQTSVHVCIHISQQKQTNHVFHVATVVE